MGVTVPQTLLAIAVGLLVCWLLLLVSLAVARPRGILLTEVADLLPDLHDLVYRLAGDQSMPRRSRWQLWFLTGYLALPIDPVPAFVPVLGRVSDTTLIVVVLRTVVLQTEPKAFARHWRGTDDDLFTVLRLAGLPIALPPGQTPAGRDATSHRGR